MLQGDDAILKSRIGPLDIACVAPELCSVFIVKTGADGTQTGRLALTGEIDGGLFDLSVRIPESFRVQRITDDGERFTVTSDDGRSAHGTPSQFARSPGIKLIGRLYQPLRGVKILDREYNPLYEQHFEESFLATHLLPVERPLDRDWQLPMPAHLETDPVLGEIRRSDIGENTYEAAVPVTGGEICVGFDSAGPEKVIALLPHARALVRSFDRILRDGIEFLWNWGLEGGETEEERVRFLDEILPPACLFVYRSGDFELHFTAGVTEEFIQNGFWAVVLFRADMRPVGVTFTA
ncbi:hypothetical protein AB0I72_14530 [Nocardiopsis sp. NPDC049922]|uniref:hypothetical protein n=1 Tax=Nocardiopsis sp. NPDC049922 TaxID=3155157 RepID=UPI0033EDA565